MWDKSINIEFSCNIPKEDFEFHMHDLYEIYYFIDGKVDYFIEKSAYKLKRNDVLIMRSDELHKASIKDREKYERYIIHFDPRIVSDFFENQTSLLDIYKKRKTGEGNLIRLDLTSSKKLTLLFKQYILLDKEEEKFSKEEKMLVFFRILLILGKGYVGQKDIENYQTSNPKITKVIEYIIENLKDELRVDKIAKYFYLSPQHLNRLFKKHVGTSIHRYIVYKRIQKAKEYLKNGVSVQDACINSGFNDYSNFIRTFKKKTGISPGKYKGNIL